MKPKTINEHLAEQRKAFAKLSKSRQAAVRRAARAFIWRHPAAADQNGFWRDLSARHVLQIK